MLYSPKFNYYIFQHYDTLDKRSKQNCSDNFIQWWYLISRLKTKIWYHYKNWIEKFTNFNWFSVRCSSKRPAVTCVNMVWRFTGLSSAQYGPPVPWSVSNWSSFSIFLNLLHSVSMGKLFTKVTKTVHKVYLLLVILFHILM